MTTVLWEQGYWRGWFGYEIDGGRRVGVEYTSLSGLALEQAAGDCLWSLACCHNPLSWEHMVYMAGTHGVIQLSPLGAGGYSGQGGVAVQAHMALEHLAGRL